VWCSVPQSAKPRQIAFDALRAVHRDGAYANLVLPGLLQGSGLDPRDRAFTTALAYGSLRREGELDVVITDAAGRGVETIDETTIDVLRLGVYQALHMRVPPHAVVDQSVQLARSLGAGQAAGFVNAVLRSVTRQPRQHWEDLVRGHVDIQHAHPRWIARAIGAALAECDGEDELDAALISHNQAPGVTVALLPGLAEATPGDRPTPYSPVGFQSSHSNPTEDERIASGAARVQDEGSQLAALVLSRARPLRAGERLLDMCAGPGGKTALLAADAGPAGASVRAIEKIPHRVELVRDSTRALMRVYPGALRVEQGDSALLEAASGRYDRILLDAPCTGLGALRRRPEARWRKSPDDLQGLVALQRELITAAVDVLAPGGLLAYVTCSPVPHETTGVVSWALELFPQLAACDTPSILDRIALQPLLRSRRGSAVQLWTHRHGTDAMFIQLLESRVP